MISSKIRSRFNDFFFLDGKLDVIPLLVLESVHMQPAPSAAV